MRSRYRSPCFGSIPLAHARVPFSYYMPLCVIPLAFIYFLSFFLFLENTRILPGKPMGKQKFARKPAKRREPDTDDDDVYDAVDLFHKSDRELKKNINIRKPGARVEVLNVEGDYSEDEGKTQEQGNVSNDDWDDESDREKEGSSKFDEDLEDQLPSRENWGKKRQAFYSTSYVDNDIAVGNEDEEEDALLEEEDATARQRVLDAAIADLDIYEKLDENETQVIEVVKKVDHDWNPVKVQKKNKTTAKILEDYKLKMEMFNVIVKPLFEVAQLLPAESPLKLKLQLCANTYGVYLCNVQLWLSMKADSIAQQKETDFKVDGHPALEKISTLKKMTDQIDSFVGRNSDLFTKLIKKAKEGKTVDVEEHYPIVSEKRAIKKKLKEEMEEEALAEELEENDDEMNEGRRGINYTIEKNKAQQYRKKKAPGNSKVRKRQQFKSAMKRQNSQRPKLRKEEARYSGESRGIRISTIKSVKLKA
ncbi:unnamed protein product, partial [Mesorhabditis belari]|uniref:Sas10 C-terminal domain-containing protein n=1 Tax=Mesorhabditis belari TaxID=2138241 RepID=A0AAF3FGA3_9BILA